MPKETFLEWKQDVKHRYMPKETFLEWKQDVEHRYMPKETFLEWKQDVQLRFDICLARLTFLFLQRKQDAKRCGTILWT